MSGVPLYVRMGLCNLWQKPDAPAQTAIKALREVLGYQVDVSIDIARLWSELQHLYPDPKTFVPSIISAVQAWAECLTAGLEDEGNATWTEKLLELVMEHGSVVKARVEARPGPDVRTAWSAEGHEFVIVIPECSPPYDNDLYSTIASDLWSLFDQSSQNPEAASKADDGGGATVNLPFGDKQVASPTSTAPTILPSISSLAKPETLFSSQVPYHMILQVMPSCIIVQGSHQPSLKLMKEYFQKHARIDRNDSNMTPYIKAELQQSMFSQGALLDSLAITWNNNRGQYLNPVLFISFIESVMGYRNIPELSSPSQWQFKRDTPFA